MGELSPRSKRAPDLLVISRVVIDYLDELNGAEGQGYLGGSGFWAAFGAAFLLEEVAITSKVGEDFEPYYALLRSIGIRDDGLITSNMRTSRTRVTYEGDIRHEEPIPNWDAHVAMRTMPSDFGDSIREPRSYYIFRDWHPEFWEEFARQRHRGAPVLWEIPSSVCAPSQRANVQQALAVVDVLSINLEEATNLCGDRSPAQLISDLHELGATTVALRLGSEGAIVSREGRVLTATSIPGVEVVDVTGAGNSFSGAFLAALTLGHSLDDSLREAMAAAAVAIGQIGPPTDSALARRRWEHYRDLIEVAEYWKGE